MWRLSSQPLARCKFVSIGSREMREYICQIKNRHREIPCRVLKDGMGATTITSREPLLVREIRQTTERESLDASDFVEAIGRGDVPVAQE